MTPEKVLLNPERLRIIQYLTLHGESSVADILAANNDISRTTLYRHINLLEKSGFIRVTKETPIRGTIEKRYVLNQENLPSMNAKDVISQMLFGLISDFNLYLSKHPDSDLSKDLLFCQTSSIFMSDAEYTKFLASLSKLLFSVIQNEETKDRKLRRLTFVSSPTQFQKETEK